MVQQEVLVYCTSSQKGVYETFKSNVQNMWLWHNC